VDFGKNHGQLPSFLQFDPGSSSGGVELRPSVLLAPPVGQLFFRVCWPVHVHGPHPQPARVGLKPQFVSADLSRSGLRFQTPAKPKDSLRGSAHHPPHYPHYSLMTHTPLGRPRKRSFHPLMLLSTVALISHDYHAMRHFSVNFCRRPTQLVAHSTFFPPPDVSFPTQCRYPNEITKLGTRHVEYPPSQSRCVARFGLASSRSLLEPTALTNPIGWSLPSEFKPPIPRRQDISLALLAVTA